MLLNFARRNWTTLIGGTTIVALVAASGLYLGAGTVDRLIETSVNRRAQTFADYLVSDPAVLNAFLTGVSRDPDIEAHARTLASLSDFASFSLFDSDGRETFSTGSAQYEWLLRNRPGGIVTESRLSAEAMEQPGRWQAAHGAGGPIPAVVMPLIRDGQTLAYLSVTVDMVADQLAYAQTLSIASMTLVLILVVAAGLPALIYMRRKRRMEEADERIVFLHNHDALTNLLNRRRMHEETDRLLATSRATRERMALWFIDVDGLSEINDSYGQASGDEVLRVTAGRLSEVVEQADLLSRVGSDDFAVLQRQVSSEESLRALAHRILDATAKPIDLGEHSVIPCLSLGVATMPDHGRTYAELIKHAELALQTQKALRRADYTLFDLSMDEESHRRRVIEQKLRAALEGNGFELFYQPIVSGDGERLLGFEALIRMPDGDGGHIPPSVFIPIAEARGYIKAIGSWVIGEAARQAAQWPDELFISINLSAVQFRDGDLVSIVKKALREAGIPGRRLGIEVVESLLLEQSDDILEQLRALRRLGISVDMDDFGTGYSSLGYLWRFPFDKLKIDQSFMAAFQEGQSSVSQILATIISLAHHLGLKVTAEGIETAEQAALLHSFGCDQLQGYFFGKPMPADKVAAEILHHFSARTAAAWAAQDRALGVMAVSRAG
ncbi:putative bifunctional diguanylate cyclase/phosphodiesterase [Aureimonas populi]|uniref:Bifunctional diguanylate cyclase/phosphodiesterase n=1 Tax=Aureimonas populi TaxID=1701758 RepID=A0ABW5CM09_9HYPH|nr:bifunctional diguanylate cyclase/phosphodiesterase [Aureimonas populi]